MSHTYIGQVSIIIVHQVIFLHELESRFNIMPQSTISGTVYIISYVVFRAMTLLQGSLKISMSRYLQ